MKRILAATALAVSLVIGLGASVKTPEVETPAFVACKPATGPIVDADAAGVVEAGVATVTDVCSLITGVDDNGAVRTICATIEEIAQVIAYVLTLRQGDAGAPAGCSTLPGSTFCATSAETAKGILFLVRERQARASLDGGVR